MASAADYVVSGIRQSDVIFGCILLAFFIFITAKGELPRYMKVFI